MSLVIPFDPAGLDPKVATVLDDIVVALQTWINTGDQTVKGNLVVNGMLTVNGQPRVSLVKGGSQTIITATDTIVTWPGATAGTPDEVYDTHSPAQFDTSLNAVRFLEAGLYHVAAMVQWDGNAAGTARVCKILLTNVNSNTVGAIVSARSAPDATNGPPQYVSVVIPISAADVTQSGGCYVRIQVFQDSGGNRTVGASAGNLADWFQVTKLL